jgi:hypothetical protein
VRGREGRVAIGRFRRCASRLDGLFALMARHYSNSARRTGLYALTARRIPRTSETLVFGDPETLALETLSRPVISSSYAAR